jgi:hypothetical protein
MEKVVQVNEHTGEKLKTKPTSDQYRDNWDKIFSGKKPTKEELFKEKKDGIKQK